MDCSGDDALPPVSHASPHQCEDRVSDEVPPPDPQASKVQPSPLRVGNSFDALANISEDIPT